MLLALRGCVHCGHWRRTHGRNARQGAGGQLRSLFEACACVRVHVRVCACGCVWCVGAGAFSRTHARWRPRAAPPPTRTARRPRSPLTEGGRARPAQSSLRGAGPQGPGRGDEKDHDAALCSCGGAGASASAGGTVLWVQGLPWTQARVGRSRAERSRAEKRGVRHMQSPCNPLPAPGSLLSPLCSLISSLRRCALPAGGELRACEDVAHDQLERVPAAARAGGPVV